MCLPVGLAGQLEDVRVCSFSRSLLGLEVALCRICCGGWIIFVVQQEILGAAKFWVLRDAIVLQILDATRRNCAANFGCYKIILGGAEILGTTKKF